MIFLSLAIVALDSRPTVADDHDSEFIAPGVLKHPSDPCRYGFHEQVHRHSDADGWQIGGALGYRGIRADGGYKNTSSVDTERRVCHPNDPFTQSWNDMLRWLGKRLGQQ